MAPVKKPQIKHGLKTVQIKRPGVYKAQINRLQKRQAKKPGVQPRLANKTQRAQQQLGLAQKMARRQNPPAPPAPSAPAAPGGPPAATTPAPTNPVTPYTPDTSNGMGGTADPNNLFQVGNYTPTAGQPDPRGPDYWANLAKLQFQAQNDYSASLRDQSYADINASASLDTMHTSRRRQERGLAESLISRGLVNSGHHDRGQAEDEQDYVSQVGEFTRSKQQEDAARKAAQQAIIQGFSVDEAALMAEAVANQAEGMYDEAAEAPGENTAEDVPPVGYPGQPGAKKQGGGGGKQGGGGKKKAASKKKSTKKPAPKKYALKRKKVGF